MGFGSEMSHLGLEGRNLAGTFCAQQHTRNTCDNKAGPGCQLTSFLFINEYDVGLEIRCQSNRFGLSPAKL